MPAGAGMAPKASGSKLGGEGEVEAVNLGLSMSQTLNPNPSELSRWIQGGQTGSRQVPVEALNLGRPATPGPSPRQQSTPDLHSLEFVSSMPGADAAAAAARSVHGLAGIKIGMAPQIGEAGGAGYWYRGSGTRQGTRVVVPV